MLGSTRNDYDALEVAHAQKTSAANAHLLRKQWLEVGLLSEVRQPLTQSRQPDVPTKQRRAYTILIHIDAHSARIRLGRYCKPTAAASKTGATNLPTRTVPSCSSNGTPVIHATRHNCARICTRCDAQTPCRNSALTHHNDGNSDTVRCACVSPCALALRPPGTNERSECYFQQSWAALHGLPIACFFAAVFPLKQ